VGAVSGGQGLALQPLLEAGCREAGLAVVGDEVSLSQLGAEVALPGSGDHAARVVPGAQGVPGEFVEVELLRAGYLDDPVSWLGESRFGDRGGDVLGGHRLDQ